MIEYRPAKAADIEAVREFLAANGWEKRTADAERFRAMVERASSSVVAYDEGRIVGFARAISDGVSNGYIGTVVVAADQRGKGVGRAMVERLMGDDPDVTWVLRAGHGSAGFWRKMGFTESGIAMERNRRQ